MRYLFLLHYLLLSLLSNNVTAAKINVRTYIPDNARLYKYEVIYERDRILPDIPSKGYVGALIEHESCVRLTSKRCWSPDSTLSTSRELGVGFFQITKAYKKDGTIRFDTLADLKRQYRKELYELNWYNIKDRPDLQVRAGMLLIRSNYRSLSSIKDPMERLRFSDSAFNGGIGNVLKARRVCGTSKDCDPNIWFENTENTIPQSRKILYGNRSAYDINRHHVRDVFLVRLKKYEDFLK